MDMWDLADLGWTAHQQQQFEDGAGMPARITAVDRDRLSALSVEGEHVLHPPPGLSTGEIAVGDWGIARGAHVVRVLERKTQLSRRAAGTDARVQLIAANVDLLAIVSSCNADFNVPRLERYLALAASSGVMPLIVLTKADQSDDPGTYRRQAEALSDLAMVEVIDARDPHQVAGIAAWMRPGQTLALVGSSGVGKTTIMNGLTGAGAETADIREDDAKGRHTTTRRNLVRATGGFWILDMPGMRALRLAEAGAGIDEVFADIADLAGACRFSDCGHETEPGCAVQAAVAAGDLDAGRLERWRKLQREDLRNSETIAEARARDRAFGKKVRRAMEAKQR